MLSAEALSSSKSSTILETYSNEDVEKLVLRLKTLNGLLQLDGKFDYKLTTDASDIEKRKDVDRMALEIILENFEYFSKLHNEPEKKDSK